MKVTYIQPRYGHENVNTGRTDVFGKPVIKHVRDEDPYAIVYGVTHDDCGHPTDVRVSASDNPMIRGTCRGCRQQIRVPLNITFERLVDASDAEARRFVHEAFKAADEERIRRFHDPVGTLMEDRRFSVRLE